MTIEETSESRHRAQCARRGLVLLLLHTVKTGADKVMGRQLCLYLEEDDPFVKVFIYSMDNMASWK